jgi:hypothetical protein
MTGTSSDVAFADAYVEGVDFDAKAAYDADVKNATVAPPASGVGRKGMATSPFLGCTSTEEHEGMSWALEGYLDDHGIARMGEKLHLGTGEKRYKEESAYFLDRAQEYVNMFDAKAGFFQGRDAAGNWRVEPEKYDPRVWGHDYTETDGWGYAFTAPQDSRSLADLYGGPGRPRRQARRVPLHPAVGPVPLLLARLLPAGDGQRRVRHRLPAVHQGDRPPGERPRAGRQGPGEQREEHLRAGPEGSTASAGTPLRCRTR